MKNNFTTPAFAKTLKEHGIVIDTQFYWENNGNGLRLMAIACDSPYIICIGEFDPTLYGSFVCEPAYPLTEVLGWLPKHVNAIIDGHHYNGMDLCCEHKNGKLQCGYVMQYEYQCTSWPMGSMPIEDLIIQGLTEGWLTKETILQAIKDNAK
jgi:hypothetical protein